MGYANGGQFSFSSVTSDMTLEDVKNVVAKMQKELNWLLNNLDSANVSALNTSITQVKSEYGETFINGPMLEMYDSTGTLRLHQGLDTVTGNFIFEMFDKLGTPTLGLDSNGEAVFMGNIQTAKNAYVGDNIYMNSSTYNPKGLYFNNETKFAYTSLLGLKIETDKDLNLYSGDALSFAGTTGIDFVLYGGNLKMPYNSYLGVVTASNQIARIGDIDSAITAAIDDHIATYHA